MMRVRPLVQLVRAPAALSVPGDVLAGAASGGTLGRSTPALTVSSCCLYWAGMALNDYADRHVDAVERPHRPIPSGAVAPGLALGIAGGLTGVGLTAATVAGGRRALAAAVPLTAAVWGYDLALKNTRAGPATMAAARTLDVLLGASAGRLRDAAPAAATVGAHTLAVTTISRAEVSGGDARLPAGGLAATAAVTTAAAGLVRRGPRRRVRATAALAPLTTYAAGVGRPQVDALRDPSPARLQRAVGAGILGMIPLQSALLAGRGAYRTASAVLAAFPLARRLSRKVSPT